MAKTSSRSQYICHKLASSGLFSPQEMALLAIINSRPHYCLETLKELGRMLNRSTRTVQYTLEKLISKGIVKKTYTCFKRMKLIIVSIDEQNKIISGGIVSQLMRYCSFKKRRNINKINSDTQSIAGPYTQSIAGPINKSNLNKSIIPDKLKNLGKSLKSDMELNFERERQLKMFRESLV